MSNTEYKPPKSLQVAAFRAPNFALDEETQKWIDSNKKEIRRLFEEAATFPADSSAADAAPETSSAPASPVPTKP